MIPASTPPAVRRAALAALLVGLAAAAGCAGGAAGKGAPGAPAPLSERLGIEVQGLRLAAAGYLVELRYRVLDAARAAAVLEGSPAPQLLSQATGKALGLAGAATPAAAREPGKTYSLYFDNTRRLVAAGAKATAVLGGLEVRDLAVAE